MQREKLQFFSQKIIELSSITEMDVCVVDANLVCIIGTGRYSGLINGKPVEKALYDRLFQGRRKYLLVKPNEDRTCRVCEYLHKCSGLIHLAVPFQVQKQDNMLLMFTAAKDHYKKELTHNTTLYLHLVDYFSKQIENEWRTIRDQSAAICQGSVQSLINLIDKNVAIVKGDHFLYVNDSLRELFGIDEAENPLGQQNSLDLSPAKTSDKRFQLSAEVGGEQKYFQVFPRTIDKNLGLKMIFVEPDGVKNNSYFDTHIFYSPNIRKAIDIAKKVSSADSTILLEGESGTGKEVFADGIHLEGNRAQANFISVNCAAIPETLWESEFFGYADGAFTGARKGGKIGKFQAADRGTLFLDEIEEMPLAMQAKLLRVLETKTIIPVGSNREVDVDVRIIAATNKNLADMVSQGLFRKDLFYRLNVVKITIPPLRERKEDIIPLANYFLKGFSINSGGRVVELTAESSDCLVKYAWPGNIRELKNAIEYAFLISSNTYISPGDLPGYITEEGHDLPSNVYQINTIKDFEYNALRACIGTYGLSQEGRKKIEEKLGISRATLYRKLKKYNLR